MARIWPFGQRLRLDLTGVGFDIARTKERLACGKGTRRAANKARPLSCPRSALTAWPNGNSWWTDVCTSEAIILLLLLACSLRADCNTNTARMLLLQVRANSQLCLSVSHAEANESKLRLAQQAPPILDYALGILLPLLRAFLPNLLSYHGSLRSFRAKWTCHAQYRSACIVCGW